MTDFSQILHTHLDPMQLAVAQHLHGPLYVLAGAGAGKTRAITYRIANAVHCKVAAPQNILALTFTTRAAGEMRHRLRQIGISGVQVKTFHAAALSQLNYFWANGIGGPLPELKENPVPLVSQAAAKIRMPTDVPTIRDLRDAIAWSKVQLITPEDYAQRAATAGYDNIAGQTLQDVAQLIKAYEELKTERAVIDFEDVILILIGLLLDRPDIAKEIRSQYKYFVADEFQDVSPMQHRLLQLWLGSRKEICAVGDISQTIYSFAGANSRFLADFPHYWAGAKKIVLNRDYRSTPQIVDLANRVISDQPDTFLPPNTAAGTSAANTKITLSQFSKEKKRNTESSENSAGAHRNQTQNPLTQAIKLVSVKPDGHPVSFQAYPDDPAEAWGTVEKIKKLLATGKARADIAILYRANSQSMLFEKALNNAGIPYTIRGGKRFFERTEVISAMAALRATARENEMINTNRLDPILQNPAELSLENQVEQALTQIGWRKEAPDTPGASRERWESLQTIRQMAGIFAQEYERATHSGSTANIPAIRAFVTHLEESAKYEMEPHLDCVTLSSLHSAKGLEWPVVFLTGVSEGLLPISYARTDSEVAEERRLFYVGITRAATELYISYANAGAHGRERKGSHFLQTIWPEEVSRATRNRRKAKENQRLLTQLNPADAQLFELLIFRRAEIAQKEEKSPQMIFSDSILHQIALQKPLSLTALQKIKGIGNTKLSRYGLDILSVVNGFLNSVHSRD